jgi:hypothetical protein
MSSQQVSMSASAVSDLAQLRTTTRVQRQGEGPKRLAEVLRSCLSAGRRRADKRKPKAGVC